MYYSWNPCRVNPVFNLNPEKSFEFEQFNMSDNGNSSRINNFLHPNFLHPITRVYNTKSNEFYPESRVFDRILLANDE